MTGFRAAAAAGVLAVLLATVALALPPAPTPEPALATALDGVSGARFRAHVEFLADDLLEGRRAGTRGYDLAARYVATEMEKLGLEPAGTDGTFFQEVPLIESRLVESRLRLKREGRAVKLGWRSDFLMRGDPQRTSFRVEAPVVFAGYGISAPELGHDDYGAADVDGKVVAVLMGAPDSLPSEERAHFASMTEKSREAARRGAAGLLLLHTPESERLVPWRRVAAPAEGKAVTWVHPDGTPEEVGSALAGRALLGPEGVEKLQALAGPGFAEALLASRSGSARPIDLGVVATLEGRSDHRRFSSRNVVGRLPGSSSRLAASHVVYSAHLDHEGVGEARDGDSIYNGAYDNAAGAAVVLEAARVLAGTSPRPRRSSLFVFLTAEESGLLGSAYFAAQPTVSPASLVADINVDMPLFLFPMAEVVAYGGETSSLGEIVKAAAAREGVALSPDPVPEQHLFVRSDQYSFVQKGVPAVFLMTGATSTDPTVDGSALLRDFLERHYHTPADDLNRPMDLASAERFIRVVVDAGWTVAQGDEPPRWKGDTFFGRIFGGRRAD